MPTVYLIAQPSISRQPGRDGNFAPKLDALAEWGHVIVLIRPGEEPRDNPNLAMKRIRRRLEGFDPSQDFLCWAGGDTLTAVLAGAVIMDFAHDENEPFDSFQWLQWQRTNTGQGWTNENGSYVKRSVRLFLDNDASFTAPSDDGNLSP